MTPPIDREPVVAHSHLHFAAYAKLEADAFEVFHATVLETLATAIASSSHPPKIRHGFAGDYLFIYEQLHRRHRRAEFMDLLRNSMEASGIGLPAMCLHASQHGCESHSPHLRAIPGKPSPAPASSQQLSPPELSALRRHSLHFPRWSPCIGSVSNTQGLWKRQAAQNEFSHLHPTT